MNSQVSLRTEDDSYHEKVERLLCATLSVTFSEIMSTLYLQGNVTLYTVNLQGSEISSVLL